MRLLLISVFLLLVNFCFGNIFSGKVVDEDGDPLINANVVVLGEGKGGSTDLDGNFFIANLEPNTYTLVVSIIGFKTDTTQIQIPKDTYRKFILKTDIKTMQPVVVTASRQKQNLQDSPVTITVVKEEDIKSQVAWRLEDVLRKAPGVTMNRYSLSLRNCSGFSYGVGSRVLIMIDGIPNLSGDAGDTKLDAINPALIKQIEIVKNSGSALYGSNAMGGVMNFITKDPEEGMHYTVNFDFGVWDEPYYESWKWAEDTRTFYGLTVNNTYKKGPLSTSFALTTKSDESFKQGNTSDRLGITGKIKYILNAKSDYFVITNLTYEDRGQYLDWINTEHALETDPATHDDKVYSSKYTLAGIYNYRDPEKKQFFTSKLYTFVTDFNSTEYDLDNPTEIKRRYGTSSKTGLDAQISFTRFENHNLTTGAEASIATGNSTMYDTRYGFGGAAYVQDELTRLHPLIFTLGGRFDFFTVKDAKAYYQFNPKAGMVYHLTENIALRSSVGSGFRVPTLAELFSDIRVAGLVEIKPNPDLDAERSYSAEIGGNIITRSVTFDAALFSNWYTNLIEASIDEGSTSRGKFRNITKARIMGTELTLGIMKAPVALNINYLYTTSDDTDTDVPLPYRPDHNFTVSGKLYYFREIASVNCDWRYKSKRVYALYPDSPAVPEQILDLGHTLSLGKYYLTFKVNNVFQYHYSEVEKGIEDIRNYIVNIGFSI